MQEEVSVYFQGFSVFLNVLFFYGLAGDVTVTTVKNRITRPNSNSNQGSLCDNSFTDDMNITLLLSCMCKTVGQTMLSTFDRVYSLRERGFGIQNCEESNRKLLTFPKTVTTIQSLQIITEMEAVESPNHLRFEETLC